MAQKRITKSVRYILPQKKKSSFGTLEVYPVNVTFATQNKSEKIFIKVRSHIFTNISWIIRSIVIIMFPLLTIILLTGLSTIPNDGQAHYFREFIRDIETVIFSIPTTIWLVVSLLYYSTVLSYVYINFIAWYHNLYLVTNERIIHIQMKPFAGKHVAEANLTNIEDITQQVIGFFPSIFHYGTVKAQTEAHKSLFSFKNIPNPTWFRDTLSDLIKLVAAPES